MAGFFASSTSSVLKFPMPWRRSISYCCHIAIPEFSLETPVAKTPCQNSAIFSSSGRRVLSIR